MSRTHHSRLALSEEHLSPSRVFVMDLGDGVFGIGLGPLRIEATAAGWHEISEAVWSGICVAEAHSRLLQRQFPNTNKSGVVA